MLILINITLDSGNDINSLLAIEKIGKGAKSNMNLDNLQTRYTEEEQNILQAKKKNSDNVNGGFGFNKNGSQGNDINARILEKIKNTKLKPNQPQRRDSTLDKINNIQNQTKYGNDNKSNNGPSDAYDVNSNGPIGSQQNHYYHILVVI